MSKLLPYVPETVRPVPHWDVYLVLDHPGMRSPLELARAGLAAGVGIFQLRSKGRPDRETLELARELRLLATEKEALFIINDRADLALASGADGVHLGRQDLPLETVRRLVGDLIIGVSVSHPDEALAAEQGGANYLGVGPVFATPTKADARPVIGLEGLTRVRQVSGLPLVAIGGITAAAVPQAVRSGADGIAVISAVAGADDPEETCRRLLEDIASAKGRRGSERMVLS